MIQILGKLLVSFLVTNWIYCEVVLFFPQVGHVAQRFFQVVQIPTHDKWPEIANSPDAQKLNQTLQASVKEHTGGNFGIFGDSINALWESRTRKTIAMLFGLPNDPYRANLPPFLRGSEMFQDSEYQGLWSENTTF